MPAEKLSPKFRSLVSTRACLLASIAARGKVKAPSPDALAVTDSEKRRLANVEAELRSIDAAAFASITEPAPAPSEPPPSAA
jgi:hypothetical protein